MVIGDSGGVVTCCGLVDRGAGGVPWCCRGERWKARLQVRAVRQGGGDRGAEERRWRFIGGWLSRGDRRENKNEKLRIELKGEREVRPPEEGKLDLGFS
jgi:hypothetical protein